MMRRRFMVASLMVLVSGAACVAGGSQRVTDSGKGLPQVTAAFPDEVAPGSRHTLEVTVTNPGPGELGPVSVVFNRTGEAGARVPPEPIIPVGVKGSNDAIVEVEPEPSGVSTDAILYTFSTRLRQGESRTFRFVVRVPEQTGRYLNAVLVSDARDPERAGGVRVETTVRR